MRAVILTIFFLSFVLYSYGQSALGLKLYQNTELFSTEFVTPVYPYPSTKHTDVNFSRLSIAFEIESKRKITHEIELFVPEIGKSLHHVQYPMNYTFKEWETFEGKASSYSIRYVISRSLTKGPGRVSFSLGLGINPYYVHIEYIPNVPTWYYWSDKLYGFALNITPRMKYRLNKRICMDLSIPLKVYDLRGHQFHVDNPQLPNAYHTTNEFSSIFFEQAYTLRFGVMYKLK